MLLDRLDQLAGVDAQGVVQFVGLKQRGIARRGILLRRHGEQAGRRIACLQAGQGAPGFQHFGQAGNCILAHLVAAGATQEQGDQVALFDTQTLGVPGQGVADQGFVQVASLGGQVELVQFQPQALGNGAVQLTGTDQRAAQTVRGPLQGDAQQLVAFAVILTGQAGDYQLVADRQMVLQGLTEVGHFARALVEDYGLVEEMALQLLAHEVHLGAQ